MNNIEYSEEQLIRELLANPAKFYKFGRPYELLQKYFYGLPVDTLRPLLMHEDANVRKAAIFIASELGEKAKNLIEEVGLLINDPDPKIQWDALESVMVCSTGDYLNKFYLIIIQLESHNDSIRRLAMRLVSNADLSQLKMAYELSAASGHSNMLHNHGLSVLLRGNSINQSEIALMLSSQESLIRIYGAIAADRLFDDFPDVLEFAATSSDPDIRRFSLEALESKNRTANK